MPFGLPHFHVGGNELHQWLLESHWGQIWTIFAEMLCIGLGAVMFSVVGVGITLHVKLHYFKKDNVLLQKCKNRLTFGFFHPYAGALGGGERVLWCAIHALQQKHPDCACVVYTGDNMPPGEMLSAVSERFGIELVADSIHFAVLTKRRLVEASTWPRFTMLGQSLGSMALGWEALTIFTPPVMIDTMGYAFTFPLFYYLGWCHVGAYVHYPTISTDMLQRVRDRKSSYNNAVGGSYIKSMLKLVYYKFFSILYGMVGSLAHVVMCNSSWTRGHINYLWGTEGVISTVFPPCDTSKLIGIPLERAKTDHGAKVIVSLAQFRPEKDHPLQLTAFQRFLQAAPQHAAGGKDRVRLVIAGGCRGEGDLARLDDLKKLAGELKLVDRRERASDDWDVQFFPNVPLDQLTLLLAQASVGLHTMRDEHFGISVVEFMACGAVTLAHDSAGPKMDIVVPLGDGQKTGFLATDAISYAAALEQIFAMSDKERMQISQSARESIGQRFSQEAFEDVFNEQMLSPLRRFAEGKIPGLGETQLTSTIGPKED